MPQGDCIVLIWTILLRSSNFISLNSPQSEPWRHSHSLYAHEGGGGSTLTLNSPPVSLQGINFSQHFTFYQSPQSHDCLRRRERRDESMDSEAKLRVVLILAKSEHTTNASIISLHLALIFWSGSAEDQSLTC